MKEDKKLTTYEPLFPDRYTLINWMYSASSKTLQGNLLMIDGSAGDLIRTSTGEVTQQLDSKLVFRSVNSFYIVDLDDHSTDYYGDLAAMEILNQKFKIPDKFKERVNSDTGD